MHSCRVGGSRGNCAEFRCQEQIKDIISRQGSTVSCNGHWNQAQCCTSPMPLDLDNALLIWPGCCSRCQHSILVELMLKTNNGHLLEMFDMKTIVGEWLVQDITARLAPGETALVAFWGDELQLLECDGRAQGRPGLAAQFTQVMADICRRAFLQDLPVRDHAVCASSHLLVIC